MATLYKSIYLCASPTQVNLDLSPYFLDWWVDTVSKPVWVTEYQDSISDSTVAYGINGTGIAAGTYRIDFSLFEDDASGTALGDFYIEIIIPSACDNEQDICCGSGAVTLRWLSREGAIMQWTFAGVRTFEMTLGDAPTFKNRDIEIFYSERKNVFNGKTVSTKQISKEQADFLDSLKYAIQAWEWDGETATPILLSNDSFIKYKTNTKIFETSIKYLLAQQVIIQTQ